MNRLALDLIGNPMTFTLTSVGLDLIILPDGPLKARVYAPTGHATIRIDGKKFRLRLNPGAYRVNRGRHHNMKCLLFRGAMTSEYSWTH